MCSSDLWSATCYDGDGAPLGSSGSFANATLASTSFTAPVADSGSTCDLKLKVTDDCGRMTYSTLTINVGNQPPTGTRMQLLVTVSMLLIALGGVTVAQSRTRRRRYTG